MKKDFLFEVLVQELPYKFIPSAIAQLKSSSEKLFKENGIEHGEINVWATPRRIALYVNDLALSQKSIEKDAKGPILNIAKNENGEYTPAAIGFAKKNNVDISALYEKDNYIWAKIKIEGKDTKEVIKENFQNLILKLQGSHFMRWGSNSEKFSRPIENIVALLGDEIVDVEILGKVATNKTQGHRYSQNREITIDNPQNYINLLRNANVIIKQDERQNAIIENATKCAVDNGYIIKFDDMEELLEEVTFITEWPVAVMCDFDEKYLQIPDVVTTTVMSSHQRYFPLWEKSGKLANRFITMANYVGDDFSNIKAGNQRVICARLEDGVFFYNEDTKTKLIDKLDALKGMTFQKGLGTLFDKTQRMIKISDKLADILHVENKNDVLRCATLAKCDLSCKLVFEFTELQGFIGEDYARVDGENSSVSKGICEHYFPLGANTELPSEIVGQIVSIADKVDTICALFISTQGDKKKKRPTGSADPLGARRAAIGVLKTIIEKKLEINLDELIKYCLDLLSKEFSIELEECIYDEINEFFNSRLMFNYEKEFSTNLFNSILKFNPLISPVKFIERANIIKEFQNSENFALIKENANRVSRIIKEQNFENINENLFVFEEEKALYQAILKHNSSSEDLTSYIKSLEELIQPTVQFFDKVLVMDKDEDIKNNRIALLCLLKKKFDTVCDFEKI